MFILSAFRTEHSESMNIVRHTAAMALISSLGLTCHEVIGRYKGSNELSISVEGDAGIVVSLLAVLYSQESYLQVDDITGQALLVYGDNRVEMIGRMTAVSKEVADAASSSTYVPYTNSYFVAV